MKRILTILLAGVFIFSACSAEPEVLAKKKMKFAEVKIDDKSYFFEYPDGAVLEKDNGVLFYADCKIRFGQGFDLAGYGDLKFDNNNIQNVTFEAGYKDNVLKLYVANVESAGFSIWADEGEVSSCVDLINGLAVTFTDELIYVSEKYSFKTVLPADFKVEYLPLEGGVIVKKWIEEKGAEPQSYRVEMGMSAVENFEKFQNIADFVAANYAGYSTEFAEMNDFSGYYVNETIALEAVSHFFVLSADGNLIYDIYLRVPGNKYVNHEQQFEDFVKKVVIF